MEKPDDEELPGSTGGEGEGNDTTPVHSTGPPDSTPDIVAMLQGFMLNQQQSMQAVQQQISQLQEEVQKGKTKQLCVVTPLAAANPDTLTRPAPQSPAEVLSEHLDKEEEAERNFQEKEPLTQARDESKPEEDGSSGENIETTQVLPAPDQLTVDSVDTTSAAVSWNQPPGLDQTQHHYQISYQCLGTEPHITTTSSHSITLFDLQGGTQYSVTVRTVLENGKQSQLESTTLTTILPAPDQLTVDSVDTTSAAVSWNQPPGLNQTQHQYQISYHCPGTEPHITTTSSHSITLSDLQCGTQYSVTVCTVLENGKRSELVSTTLTTVIPAPDQLTVDSVDTTSAAVSWNQPPGLDQTQHHYQISYHCPGTEPHITTTSSHSITLSDLQCGTQYSVTVCSVLENGKQSQLVSTTLTTDSPWHSMKWIKSAFHIPGRKSVLPVPDQVTVNSVDTTSAAVSWNQPPGLDKTQHHYQISYQCPGTEPHITTTSSPSITLSDLQCGTQYSVTVCTVLENGKQSQLVSTTFTTILPVPDQLTVDSVDTTSAVVSWNQPPGLDQTQHHYQISYHCPGTEPHITTTSSPSITLSDLQGGTQYSVTVCTVLEHGKQSERVSRTLTTILPAPDQLTVDWVSITSAAVSWNQPPGLDQTQHHYQISYHCPGTEPHITTTSSHSITLSDLQRDTEYSVTVCTVLENGKKSQLVSTTLTTVLPGPDQLTVDWVSITSAAVSWSQPPGLDQTQHHYKISYHCPGTEPHITTTSSPSITLSDLQRDTEYSVTVCTVLENGKQSQLVSTTLTTDGFLQQEMVQKMSMCQFAVPLLLPNCDTKQITLMLLGESSLSKSQILNKLLSNPQQYHDTFVHHDMECGDVPRQISDGLVEISWYFPCGNRNIDMFTKPVAVANLRGDIRSFETQFSFLCQT
ncbi:fibronectin-like [Salvelinus fontinalis]|uniref:fibronectin-like n=1 Tax=Salvelinus fontinalis TaxID=8038 RepID=UPI0024868563|nr:fibronectin-like [Salvelinus fontinalis]